MDGNGGALRRWFANFINGTWANSNGTKVAPTWEERLAEQAAIEQVAQVRDLKRRIYDPL